MIRSALLTREVLLGRFGHQTRQQDQAQEVGKSHQAQGNIAENPNRLQRKQTSNKEEADVDPTVNRNGAAAEQVLGRPVTVVGPRDRGRNSEQQAPRT